MKPWQWLVALIALIARRLRTRRPSEPIPGAEPDRIVAAGAPARQAENLVVALLGIAAALALGFVVVYGAFSPAALPNELLGVCLGGSLICIGAALTVVAKRLVVTEELEDDYPEEHPAQQREVIQIVHESGSRITRKRLLLGAGAATGGALGLAAITPALSLGPVWDTAASRRDAVAPGRAGGRREWRADPGGRRRGADLLHRLPRGRGPGSGRLSARDRAARSRQARAARRTGPAWAPSGILAYSKICTHAGCAVALFRKPTFSVLEPNEALVCPCHYSTFDPYTGGTVTYGPAGRPLPQLPLMIDAVGHLRAAGNFSGRVGPSWWAVNERPSSE